MISLERKYQYTGSLLLRRSRVLKTNTQPKDDNVHWLFLKVARNRYTFIYKIEEPKDAEYNNSFNILMHFIADDINEIIHLGCTYEVWRREEIVGSVKIINRFNLKS